MSWTLLFFLSLIEGLTEFLPVSSTGHLMLFSSFVGVAEDPFVRTFNIVIQFGAILSVLTLYYRKFFLGKEFYYRLLLAFLPAAVIGYLLKDWFDALLSSPAVICWALILGGLVLILTDRRSQDPPQETEFQAETLSLKKSLGIGFLQCLALIPGVSRSGATILGGLWLGLSKKHAAEFSFFLAVPTLGAASFYKLVSHPTPLKSEQWFDLGIGFVLSYLFALLALVSMMKIVTKYGFKHFGWYRIFLGLLGLLLIYKGVMVS